MARKRVNVGGERQSAQGVLYVSHPGPQDQFMESEAEEVLYGGAAGGGKSYALRAWGVRYCMTYPNAQIVLFRRTYRELEDTHILAIQREVPSSVATYHTAAHNLIFPNGAVFMFRFCEGDEEVRTYDTTEFDAMLFDELTSFTQFSYTYLLSRCRSTKSWWPGRRIRAGATPLGVGHSWVKARWIDPAEPSETWKAPVSEGGMQRQFIPAKVTDNPALMRADPDYMNLLRGLPEEEYRAKALGDWSVFTGQFFTRWRDEIHTIEPFEVGHEWDKFICVDYGFNKPYAVLWFARPPGTQAAWVYREHYGSGVKPEEQIYQARQAVRQTEERIKGAILDPSMFAKINFKGDRFRSLADDWRDQFANVCPIIRGDNARVAGWQLVRQMLDWTEGPDGGALVSPSLVIMRNCPQTIRTIPLLVADDNRPEDVDTDGEDHAADALRYGLMHAFRGRGAEGVAIRGVRLSPRGLTLRR